MSFTITGTSHSATFPSFPTGIYVASKKYDTTVDRDSDQLRSNPAFYPTISYVNGVNSVGSVNIDVRGLELTNNGTECTTLSEFSGLSSMTHLYDVLSVNYGNQTYHVSRTASEAQQYVSANDSFTIAGVCVIPESVFGTPKFVSLEDLDDTLCFGYFDTTNIDGGTSIANMLYEKYLEKDTRHLIYSGQSYLWAYFTASKPVKLQMYPCSYVDGTLATTYNVVPVMNRSTVDNNLYRDTQRVVQYTSIMASDSIKSGKSSSYFDSGKLDTSYFYYISGYNTNYAQPSWYKNSHISDHSTLPFYYDRDLSKYVSFLNPLSQFNGKANTTMIVSSITNACTFLSDVRDSSSDFSGIDDENVDLNTDYSQLDTSIYIPSVGEFSFLMARLEAINDVIASCGGTSVDKTKVYMTSNECSYDGVYAVWPFNGSLMNVYKSEQLSVRPFVDVTGFTKT